MRCVRCGLTLVMTVLLLCACTGTAVAANEDSGPATTSTLQRTPWAEASDTAAAGVATPGEQAPTVAAPAGKREVPAEVLKERVGSKTAARRRIVHTGRLILVPVAAVLLLAAVALWLVRKSSSPEDQAGEEGQDKGDEPSTPPGDKQP